MTSSTARSQCTHVVSLLVFAALLAVPAHAGDLAFAGKAYVSNTDSANVTVVDLGDMSVLTTVPVDSQPRAPAITPDGAFVYVPHRFSNTLSVIDTLADLVVDTIALTGNEPYNCVVTPDGAFVYVVCKGSSTVSVVDVATGVEITSIDLSTPGASPEGVAITPDGSKLYVVNRQDDTVDVIATATNTLTAGPIPVGSAPRDAAVSPDGSKVIVVGEGAPVVILTATDSLSATVFPDIGTQRDVAVAGDLAFVTNFSGSLDVYDLAAQTFEMSIALSGALPYGVDVLADGTLGWISFQDDNQLQTVDLVGGVEVGAPTSVGSSPRGLVLADAVVATDVLSYFLPRTLKLQLKGEGLDRLVASGFVDDGGLQPDWTQPITLKVGGFMQTFTLVPNAKGTAFKFKDAGLRFLLRPNLKGSSRGRFVMKINKTTLGGLIDPEGELDMQLSATGLPDAHGVVTLTKGRFRLSKKAGALISPEFFPTRTVAKLGEQGLDSLRFKGGFATGGMTPTSLSSMRFAFGPTFTRTVAGAQLVQKGDRFKFSQSTNGITFKVSLDFRREVVRLSAKRYEFGPLDAETVDIIIDTGTGAGLVRNTVRLGAKGAKRFY